MSFFSLNFDFRLLGLLKTWSLDDITGRRINKPLGGKLDDSVELALQGSRTFAHLDILAVFSNRRVDLSLGPGLGLFQTQKFGGRR